MNNQIHIPFIFLNEETENKTVLIYITFTTVHIKWDKNDTYFALIIQNGIKIIQIC